MVRGRVGIESLWSPAMTDLKKRNIKVRMAAPTEGYRAWYGDMSISRHVKGHTLKNSLPLMLKVTRQRRLKHCLVAFLSKHGLEWVA